MQYLSNLDNLEFDGKFYDHGDELKVTEDNEAAAEILARRGDATRVEEGDPKVTSNGTADPLDHDNNGRKGGSKPAAK
jgi:general stress protein YciG